ncbi:hypothetical protein ACFVW2_02680 [Streptomyces sp. NPDC058171]
MQPFPDPYPTILSPDATMDGAFSTAMDQLSGADQDVVRLMPITIAHVRQGAGSYETSGQFQTEEDYSASLLKVPIMYAAYELLRNMVNLGFQLGDVTTDEYFQGARDTFNDAIFSAVPLISNTVERDHVLPDYENLFQTQKDPTTGVHTPSFTDAFAQNLDTMLRDANALGAAIACIHALRFGYTNGALAAGGLFREGAGTAFPPNGIWNAGDFSTWTDVVIPVTNDVTSAQATTTSDMANLYALLTEEILTGVGGFSPQMLGLLALNANNGWFNATTPPIWDPATSNVTVSHTKVGEGKLKTGQFVLSEGIIVHEQAHGADFIVVYQDLRNGSPTELTAVARLIENTIDAFLA